MSKFRPLFAGQGPAFIPLQLDGADGEVAPDFKPLYGEAQPIPSKAPAPPLEAEPLEQVEEIDPEGLAPELPVEEDISLIRAREQGFAIGREEGLAAAEAEVADRMKNLDALVKELTSLRSRLFRSSVEDLGAAITHIAERVVRRELAVSSAGVQQLVLDVLDHVQADDEVVIRIAPEDERQMRNAAPAVLEHLGRDATFRIGLDPSLQPGGAMVVTQLGSIDASVETRFTAFEESVGDWVIEEQGADAS